MNSSAGLAFAPHVITIGVGEVVMFFQLRRDVDFNESLCLIFLIYFLCLILI